VRARVVGDVEIARAHVSHLGEPGTTDVITFDLSEGPELDVDLLVCVDEACRQASARGHSVERELLLYVVHGVLHCMGFDDHDEAGALAMHRREDEVLSAIGVGRTFGAPADGEGR
jgi:probable rRNA maturation factor